MKTNSTKLTFQKVDALKKRALSYLSNNYRQVVVLLLVLSTFLLFLDTSLKDKIDLYVTAIAACLLLWYAKETYDLKKISNKQIKEMRKQNYLLSRPFIKVYFSNEDYKNLKTVNNGFGIAVDVKIKIIHLEGSTRYAHSRPMMSPGNKNASTIDYRDFGITDTDFEALFDPRKQEYSIFVEYKDVIGSSYKQTFTSDGSYNDGLRLASWTVPKNYKELKNDDTETLTA